MNTVPRILSLLATLAGFASLLSAQTAQITGTVKDSSSGLIAGASIIAANVDTGTTRKTVSNDEGYYTLPLLQPGKYKLTAQREGFRPVIHDGLVLAVNQDARVDIVMEIGAVTESVQVSGSAPLLEADTANLGQVIENRQVTAIPLNIRNPLFLLTLSPGVVTGPNFSASTTTQSTRNFFQADFRVGGGRSMGQEILLDGVTDTTGDRFASVIPPVDSVQEFKVQLNTYSAEFGRTTGGIVNMITKSGTNQFHGTVYDFLRNSVFDSNDFFANRSGRALKSFKRNQFGANTGGPLEIPKVYRAKDKTFFFVAYEGLRQRSPNSSLSSVPTPLQRQGDFSQTFAANGQLITVYNPLTTRANPAGGFLRDPFPGNQIPTSMIDPVGRNVLNYYPLPNTASSITGANNFSSAPSDLDNTDQFDIRLDHNISQTQRIFGRVSYNRTDYVTLGPFPASVGSSGASSKIDNYRQAVLDYSNTITPTTVLNARFGFNRARALVLPESYPFDLTSLGFNGAYQAAAVPMFPTIAVSNYTGLGSQSYNNQPRNTYELTANLTRVHGRHSIKAGFDYRILQLNSFQNDFSGGTYTFGSNFTQGPNPAVASATAGYGLASMLLGTGSGNITSVSALALERLYYAAFVQDDIKLSSRLTINLGLRFDVSPGQTERYNRLNWIDTGIASPIAGKPGVPSVSGGLTFAGNGQPRNQFDTDWNNWGPRIGFAYTPAAKMVLRGGYGISYAPQFLWPVGVDGFNTSTTWVNSLDGFTPTNFFRNPYPQGFILPGPPNPLTDIGLGVNANLRGERTPLIQQWSFSVQRELASNLLLEVTYWGNHGEKLEVASGYEMDYLPSQYFSQGSNLSQLVPNPFFGVITTGTLSAAQVTRRQLLLPYPQYTSILRQVPNAATSIYHAASVRLERRLRAGLSLLASYTFSKAIDDADSNLRASDQGGPVQNWENRRAERSVSAFNVPQRFVLSASYELPFGRGKMFGGGMPAAANFLAGGWQINGNATAQNGLPIAVTAGAGPIAEFGRLRPNSTGASARLDNPTVAQWFNTSAFTQPVPYTFGTVGRLLPDVRRDGFKSVDFSVFKNFVWRERLRTQFRFEMFNALNHPIFGAPTNALTNTSFGVVSAQANSPRQLQFALKFSY